MKVSIIIPTYKGESSILIAVKSTLSQKCEYDIEVIVVDDNGIGTSHQLATESVLTNYIKNKKIKYIKHEVNQNGSSARNTGFKKSVGDYIVFLDDDDYLFPTKIKKQIALLEKLGNDYGLSITEGFYVRLDGKGYIKRLNNNENFLYSYLMDKNYFNTSAMLIRRNLVHDLSGFDESFNRHQDWEFCSRIIGKTKISVINEPLLIKYAENRNNPSNIKTRIKQLDYFFEKLEPIIKSHLSKNEIKDIKKFKYGQILLGYIFSGKIIAGIKFLNSKEFDILDIINSFINLVKFVLMRIFNGGKKVTYSKEELVKKLKIEDEYKIEIKNKNNKK